jgi:8-hydroxy-5-deazaflavin:NADPH oxidoreductase
MIEVTEPGQEEMKRLAHGVLDRSPMTNTSSRVAKLALLALVLSTGTAWAGPPSPAAGDAPVKIGIIGAGNIGGTLARLWVASGHEVLVSSRHPDRLKPLCAKLGSRCRVGTPRDAAAFSNVVLISVPYGAMPQIGRDLKAVLAGKVVLDTGNPYPGRDGPMADEARKKGTGVASAQFLPGVRLVRAFNAIGADDLGRLGHRKPDLVAIPLAGDDAEALKIASALVRDAGFEPVIVGGLARARDFDVGTPVYTKVMSAAELRKALGLRTPRSEGK